MNERRELKRLFDALHHAGHRQYKVQLGYLHRLLHERPRFRAVFDLLKAKAADFDADTWMHENVFSTKRTCHAWPDDETRKLALLLRIVEVSVTPQVDPNAVGRQLAFSNDLDQQAQQFTRHVVFPLVDYLQSRLDTDDEVLHYLERMRRQVEWFEQEQLFAAYETSLGKGEQVYDRRVRAILFAEGVDYPFSQPSSPAGKADVVARLEGEDPLVCEIKLYDGGSYGPSYLRRGVGQAVRYAHDFGKRTAHLVVFNVSEERVELPTEGLRDDTPHLHVEGVTVFMTVVQAKPLPSASKDTQRRVRSITRDQLVPEAGEVSVGS